MGGRKKKVTVGYKYYLGEHLVISQGPIDFIKRISFDKRLAWSGTGRTGQITIDKPELYGGESREGGISGLVDFALGEATQSQNDYLQAQLGTDIPAYRGVVSVIFRKLYLGMNPYLKLCQFRAQRIFTTSSGAFQWNDAQSVIGTIQESTAVYFALDFSGSMDVTTANGETRFDNMRNGMYTVLNVISGLKAANNLPVVDIMLKGFTTGGSIFRRDVDETDIADIITWLEDAEAVGSTDWTTGVSSATSFFAGAPSGARRVLFLATDGDPDPDEQTTTDNTNAILNPISDLNVHTINISTANTTYTTQVDNTEDDGVPIVPGTSPAALASVIFGALGPSVAMNPAHIIYECLTDTTWGMGYPTADIDDTSFLAAADGMINEAMGISLLWDKQIRIEDFISEIIRHINAALYIDKVTGKFVLKLIREDYDVETLLTLDQTNIREVRDYVRTGQGDSINSVTVVYWDPETGEDATKTVENLGLIQTYGKVIGTTIQYPGFTTGTLAAKAALRDLRTLSTPLLTCTINANREASTLNIGDVFKFAWPDYHDGYVVMRVHQISFGDGRSNIVKIKCSEDIFALPQQSSLALETQGWTPIAVDPSPSAAELVIESPYLELVQQLGETEVENQLTTTPEIGYLQAASIQPTGSINAQLWTDSGAGYEEAAIVDYCPSAILTADMSKAATALSYSTGVNLDLVVIGSHFQINDELMVVDAIDTGTGSITVGRGALDTVPLKVLWHYLTLLRLSLLLPKGQLNHTLPVNSNSTPNTSPSLLMALTTSI